ncbi:hypothetical protein RPMA_13700 [Tardiphaga alba]|uniref:DUF3553 domain-containing protein n=2 Tax=Tardiphaga alba TaxID=340268 RepID=A0ABX8AF60_9BRAD|nr:hypothetical protein RPMA_13700 [Tardiphaga alba]
MIFEAPDLDPDWLTYGDRVRMSPLGLARHPTYGAREGVIVGMGTPSSVRVKFDERVTVQAIHRDYLERAPVAQRAPRKMGRG